MSKSKPKKWSAEWRKRHTNWLCSKYDDRKLSKHFHAMELASRGTGPHRALCDAGWSFWKARRRLKIVSKPLEKDRAAARKINPKAVVKITSGVRTPTHNASVGGAQYSRHLPAYYSATDCPPPAGVTLAQWRDIRRSNWPGGIGYYPTQNFIHADLGPRREWQG